MYIGIWTVVLIAFIIIEMATADALVTLWFIPGAIVTLLLTIFTDVNFMTQCIIFFATSLLAFILLKPSTQKYLRGNRVATNADRVIGKIVKLHKAINVDEMGEVKINGVVWNATTRGNRQIKAEKMVKIVAIDGTKLIVEEI